MAIGKPNIFILCSDDNYPDVWRKYHLDPLQVFWCKDEAEFYRDLNQNWNKNMDSFGIIVDDKTLEIISQHTRDQVFYPPYVSLQS